MTEHKNEENIHDILGQVAYQMKETMDTMYAALRRVTADDGRDTDESAAMLMRNFYRLRRLSANLEEAANLDAPSLPPKTNDDIVGLCAAVTESARYAAELLGLTLTFESDRASHIIALDAERVERMLLNLLSNAFKFTPRGGKVTVEVRMTARSTEIRVSDTGCGIRAEQMDTLFDRYRRLNYRDASPRGLGLGLPISRRIAADHGGTLVVFSREGEGTLAVASLENRKVQTVGMTSFIATDYSGGFNRTLLELSDAVDKRAFTKQMTD